MEDTAKKIVEELRYIETNGNSVIIQLVAQRAANWIEGHADLPPEQRIYMRLLHSHMQAARDKNVAERERLFSLIEAFRAEFKTECDEYEARFSAKDDPIPVQEVEVRG